MVISRSRNVIPRARSARGISHLRREMLPVPLETAAFCLTVDSHHVLVFGGKPAGRIVSFGPPVYLRFAFAPALGHEYLIPAHVVEDRGLEIPAPEVYDWIESRGAQFPRADVVGQTPAGQPLQRFMKELDLAAPPLAYAARSPQDFPGVPVSLVLTLDQGEAAVHPLLARAAPTLPLGAGQPAESLVESVRRWAARR